MSYQYNNQVLNAILADLGGTTTYPYDIDALNAIIGQLGGTGGHYYLIDAYNELCGIQSVTAGHKYLIDALNAINVAGGGTSEQFELPALVQLGALVNYDQPWTQSPFFALPATGVPLIAGKEVTLYGDTLVNLVVPAPSSYQVTYTCAIGTQSGNNLILAPTTGQIGDHSLTMLIKNGTKTIGTYVITLSVIALAPAGAKKLMYIDDSLGVSGCTFFDAQINAALSNGTITFVGTQGTTTKHESYSGNTWYKFITAGSPFFKGGVVDIAAYFTDNSIDVPDYVFIELGINDVFGYSNPALWPTGISDGNVNTILGYANTLVNALLAYNAGLKVIVGLPSSCDSTAAAWAGMYGTTYNPNLFTQNIKKFSLALSTRYANGAYNARVDCHYSFLNIDRNLGYPKTAGVHTNDVHPAQLGYEQLGLGKALSINKLLKADLKPSSFAASWVDDYAALTWVNNSGAATTFEIYESKNGGAYSLVYTTAANATSYNYQTWQNANLNFKIKAINGIWGSDLSAAVNLVTPLVLKTDQSSLTNVVWYDLNVAAGKTVNVNWGDGTNNNYTGNNRNLTKTYSATANPYFIKLSGDVNSITGIGLNGQTVVYGSLSKWALPTGLTGSFSLNAHRLSGDISAWIIPATNYMDITPANVSGCGFTGDLSGWNRIPDVFMATATAATNKLSGDLTAVPFNGLWFYAALQDFTGIPRGQYKNLDSGFGMYFNQNNCSQTEIDNYLVAVAAYFTTNTPIKSSLYKLDGSGMGIPSATGLAARTAIQAAYVAAGFVATITVNA